MIIGSLSGVILAEATNALLDKSAGNRSDEASRGAGTLPVRPAEVVEFG